DDLAGVKESAVIGLPHPDFGESVTAVIVPESGAELSEESVIAQLKSELANFKVPKRVFFMPELPRNTMGKVQKNVLRDTFSRQQNWQRPEHPAKEGKMDSNAIQRAARALLEARANGTLLTALPEGCEPADFAEAYAIQDAVSEALG